MSLADSEKVSEFLQTLSGLKLAELAKMRLSNSAHKAKAILEDIGREESFAVVFVRLDERTESGLVQCLCQLSTKPVFVARGAGRDKGLFTFLISLQNIFALHSNDRTSVSL
jgi:hypothetical protein